MCKLTERLGATWVAERIYVLKLDCVFTSTPGVGEALRTWVDELFP